MTHLEFLKRCLADPHERAAYFSNTDMKVKGRCVNKIYRRDHQNHVASKEFDNSTLAPEEQKSKSAQVERLFTLR